MRNWFKRNGIHFAIAGIFFVISFLYFEPVFQGKALSQGDVLHATAMSKEISDYRAKGTTILWTNQLFGGMPTYQIWVPYNNITSYVVKVLKASFPAPIDTVLLFLFGAYLLFCILKLNPWLSAAGAIAFAFSSYNIILFGAGHANQAFAIAFFAPILAGIILTLRGRYLLGGALTALFLAMELRANHIQMTYYLLLSIIILIGIELYNTVKSKTTKSFFTAVSYLAVATLLALAVNASMLWSTYEYGQESNRGKSNLTSRAATPEPNNGLSRDYAYYWSQGVSECLTFLVPDVYGSGGSEALNPDSKSVQVLLQSLQIDPAQAQAVSAQYLYWGEKPFTGGPWYFGAAICFLFIVGLMVIKDRIKWWLLGSVILVMLLSFGKNWPIVSDLFFNYVPLYNKFRAVESILTIATLCFPIMAFLAIKEIITSTNKAEVWKKVSITFYITGGLCLLLALVPDMFLSFKASNNQTLINKLTPQLGGNASVANAYADALVQDRISIAKADAWRSLFIVAIAFGLIWAFIKQKVNLTILSVSLLALTLVDLWTVDKRYLKDENFVAREDMQQPPPRNVDNIILQDTDPDYRVFDITSNDPFSDSFPSFYHKSFGGYHAAKLKRFDELQERQFSIGINYDVLNMMNVKYIIGKDPKTQQPGIQNNPTACGHAWFIKQVKYVANADEEMAAITSFHPKDTAIVDQRYKTLVQGQSSSTDTSATIKLVKYNPDHMAYQSNSATSQIAVFSEVYYDKGWNMTIDGKAAPYFRADYLLRAAQIPAGKHEIKFDFHPASYYTGESISLAGSVLLVLALGFAGYTENKKRGATKKA